MFSERQYNHIKLLAFDPWWQDGFVHGFTNQSLEEIANYPKQVHGSEFCAYVTDGLEPQVADAIYLSPQASGKIFAVRTADCLPIILRSKNTVILIHAGWRGLANGIVTKAIQRFTQGDMIEAVIGPAASIERYEVGPEVIEAIGESAVFRKEGERYYLSLSKTAENQLVGCTVFDTGICTISSPAWHSYRRDGEKRGSNFAFVIV